MKNSKNYNKKVDEISLDAISTNSHDLGCKLHNRREFLSRLGMAGGEYVIPECRII